MLGRTTITTTGGSPGEVDTATVVLLTLGRRRELVTISAAVMGIEFAYAAETAFVSPTLLKIGQ